MARAVQAIMGKFLSEFEGEGFPLRPFELRAGFSILSSKGWGKSPILRF
jgi:hypothetical protein